MITNTLSIASLSQYTQDALFFELMEHVLKMIKKSSGGGEDLRTYIQLTSAISKTAGGRMGKYLSDIIQLLMTANEDIAESDGEDEVREYIVQAFESFVTRCPDEVTDYVELILIICKEYLEYDPNYSYDASDDEDDDEEMAENDDEEEGDDADGVSDDDDSSWKVRRSAAKCVGSIIRSRPEMLDMLYTELNNEEEHTLISRFKEREEPVKLDVFGVFIDLLNQTINTTTSSTGSVTITQREEIKYVEQTKALIMARIKKQLKVKSQKTRIGIFKVLKTLTIVLQGGLGDYARVIIPAVISALNEKGEASTLKLEALGFLRVYLSLHTPDKIAPYAEKLSKAVFDRVGDKYYKIIAEALRVCGEFVPVVGSLKNEQLTKALYKNVFDRLSIQDIDQDVKESAIRSVGLIIAQLGGQLKGELKDTLVILLERLKNEITRLTTCKTFITIAEAKVDISPVLGETVQQLSSFLKKVNRALRQTALQTLSTFAQSYGSSIDQKLYTAIITDAASLVNDQDLHLAHMSLQLIDQILIATPSTASTVQSVVLPKILALLESPTLQGHALSSLLEVLAALLSTAGFSTLFNAVLNIKKDTKQVYTNVGKAVATLCLNAGGKDAENTINKFAKDLKSTDDTTKMLALFTLGEIGRNIDLSSNKTVRADIEACFESEGSEELKNAASYALGNVSVGNLKEFLPLVLGGIRQNKKTKYLLIHALKEIITSSDEKNLKPFINDTVPLLFENCANEEEGVRNVVAECLGKLAMVDYSNVTPKLKSLLKDEEVKKATVISAVKYTITEQPRDIDAQLKTDLPDFLSLLNKSEGVAVRRAAVLLLNSAAHNKPKLVQDSLDKVLPNLYAECVFDESLVRTIQLGPFKHKIDDGLELRKSSFECLDTILDQFKSRIDPNKFIAQIPNGLSDENADIKMLTFLIITKVGSRFPADLLSAVDSIVPPLTKVLKKKEKENALAQEKERHQELIKAALKAVATLKSLSGIEENVQFQDMYQKVIMADNKLKLAYEEVATGEGLPKDSMDLSA
jgi:cullin-associated NEDD8-dissociated protein 1